MKNLRWLPAVAILVLAIANLLRVWSGEAPDRQDQVIATYVTVGLSLIALLLWWLLFSRLPGRIRALSLAVMVAIALIGVSTLRLREVTGDLIPVLEWRWASSDADSSAGGAAAGGAPAALADSPSFPQFLGPDRNATLPPANLARDWSTTPPAQLWRQPIGDGWSGFVIANGLAVTGERRGEEEWTSCYELATGTLRWAHKNPVRFEGGVMDGPGPRATPAIADGRVFALDASGQLDALDLATGELLWTRNIVTEHQAPLPVYGVSASPLLHEGLVIVLAGGAAGHSLVAYDQVTGEPRWMGGGDRAAYSSPLVATLAGREQIVVLNNVNLVGHDAADGSVLWQTPWDGSTERVSQPVVLPNDRLFASTGYGIGGKLYRIAQDAGGAMAAELIWESRRLKAKFTQVVHRDDTLYGLDDGTFVALDVESGERRWKRGRYGHGHVLLVGDLLLVQTEKGEVVMLVADPDQHRELGRFQAIEGKSWNTPALSGRHLLVRNANEAACYLLPAA
ncbi:MAG: PQQ-binding-like beta-propeller repeat protein [Acidobacteriota bacterium]